MAQLVMKFNMDRGTFFYFCVLTSDFFLYALYIVYACEAWSKETIC